MTVDGPVDRVGGERDGDLDGAKNSADISAALEPRRSAPKVTPMASARWRAPMWSAIPMVGLMFRVSDPMPNTGRPAAIGRVCGGSRW